MPDHEIVPPHETTDEALCRILDDLERYAGWLGRGTSPKRVRSDVKELRTLVGGDYSEFQDGVQLLIVDIGELSNSATRELLQRRAHLLSRVASRVESAP